MRGSRQRIDVSRSHIDRQVAARELILEASRSQTRQELVDSILRYLANGTLPGPRAVSFEVALAESGQRAFGRARLKLSTVLGLPRAFLLARRPDPPDLQAPYARTTLSASDTGYAWVMVELYPKMTDYTEVIAGQTRHRLSGISYLGAWVEPKLEGNRRCYVVYIGTTPLGRIPASVVSKGQLQDLDAPTRVNAMLLPPGKTNTPVLDVKMPLGLHEKASDDTNTDYW